jgi:hypothetical protein
VALGDAFELPDGLLRLLQVSLSEDRTEISTAYTASAGGGAHTSQTDSSSGYPAGLPAPSLTDDRGTTVGLNETRIGGPDYWEATLTADAPIATDTTWIEIYGRRVELKDAPVEVTVEIERLAAIAPGRRHLWRRVALAAEHYHGGDLGPVVDALVTAGALDRDDPEIEARPPRPRSAPAPSWAALVRHGAGHTGSVDVAAATRRPQRWPNGDGRRRRGHA